MASDDFEPGEVDRLIKELAARRKPAALRPAAAAPASPMAAAPPATGPSGQGPGRAWTTARLLMPAIRTERRQGFGRASGIRLPMLPSLRLLPAHALRALPRIALRALREMPWSTNSVRVFVGLGVLLGAAMPYWPYARAWSWGLLVYLLVAELVVVTGIWGAKLTWDARLPAAHTIAIGTVVWGLGLLAAEAVPRIVYA